MNAKEYGYLRRRFWEALQPEVNPHAFYVVPSGAFKDVACMELSGQPGVLKIYFRGLPHGLRMWVAWRWMEAPGAAHTYVLSADGTFHTWRKPLVKHPGFDYREEYVCGRYTHANLPAWREQMVGTIRRALQTCLPQRVAQHRGVPIRCTSCPHELPCLMEGR